MTAQLSTPRVVPTLEEQLLKVTAAREDRLQAAKVLFESLEVSARHVLFSDLDIDFGIDFSDRMLQIVRHARIWVKRSLNLSELDLGLIMSSSKELCWFDHLYGVCREPGFPFTEETSGTCP